MRPCSSFNSLVLADFLSLFFQEFQKFELCVFHPIWVKFVMGVTLGKEQHRMFLKWLPLFFDQPNGPTKADQLQKFELLCFSSDLGEICYGG